MADQPLRVAQYLIGEYSAHRALKRFPQDLTPSGLEEAYAIQSEFVTLRRAKEGALGGYKLAYTTATMQARTGLTEPALGYMFKNRLLDSPATVRAGDYVNLGLECEIAVRLGRALPPSGTPYTRDKVADAVHSVMPAIELIDARADPEIDDVTKAMMGVSANIWNAGAVLGPENTAWREIDLTAVRGTVELNGTVVGEGFGRDIMGHPLEPLAWLANQLAARGEALDAGMTVITGSLVPPKFLSPGDHALVSIDGLGSAELNVQ